jgi:hypothetical protein
MFTKGWYYFSFDLNKSPIFLNAMIRTPVRGPYATSEEANIARMEAKAAKSNNSHR